MINREWQTAIITSYTSGLDSYGQPTMSESNREVEMVVKLYQQSNTSDVRYVDVSTIGLTKDALITDKDQVQVDNDTYKVLYVIPTSRLHQILMKRV